MKSARMILGVLCLAAGIWFLVAVFGDGPRAEAQARTFTSSKQCQECHAEAFAEWVESQHAKSWINPAVRMLSNDFSNQDCIDCHAPRPVFVTGIGERVLPRETRRVEGVDCIACHELPPTARGADGGMAGTLDDPNAACRPRVDRRLNAPEFCAGCHNQHQTVDQWRASKYPAEGKDCLACHMPYRDGDPNRGRDHHFHGGYRLSMLKEAVELRGSVAGGVYTVEVENVGAGHAFPTDERSRRADVFWRVAGETGPGAWRHVYRIRDPYRYESDIPRTLIDAGQTLTLKLEDVPEGATVEAALFYKRTPYWEDPDRPDPDRESILLHTKVLQP
jgi:hypothetical protein